MSTAHRPTWTPAQGKATRGGSRQFSSRDMAAHTRLKFRQVGQDGTVEVGGRDLRRELREAEEEARKRKRGDVGGGEGEVRGMIEGAGDGGEEEEVRKRRKVLVEALEMDRDDDDEDAEGEEGEGEKAEKKVEEDEDENDDDDDDDDDEDETAELLRELEKIKRERAEDKARQDRESTVARDEEIASGNPLLNLAAALGQGPSTVQKGGGFAVKKRWDDDLVFKNQANGSGEKGGFVNDLLRTEFHRKFMQKFIK